MKGRSVKFDPAGQTLASGSHDNTVEAVGARPAASCSATLEGHGNSVLSVAFDPTGQTLASGSCDYTVKLWERSSGKLLRTLEGTHGGFRAWRSFRTLSARATLASGSS